MDDMTDNIVLGLSNMQGMNKCYIQSFRTSLILRNVTNAIKSALTEAEVSNVDFLDWAFKEYGARRAATAADAKLAIVGMACRMPGGADDLDKFWELISSGRDTHTTIPESRFDLATHYDPTGKTENATQTPYGNFLQDPGHFDAAFFQMSPREVC
jgi:asperthecin polyketide synthase